MTYVLCALLILTGLFTVVAVLLQQGKSKGGLSGTIVGGTETFYGKEKGMKRDRLLSRITTVTSVVFMVLVAIAYVFQGLILG